MTIADRFVIVGDAVDTKNPIRLQWAFNYAIYKSTGAGFLASTAVWHLSCTAPAVSTACKNGRAHVSDGKLCAFVTWRDGKTKASQIVLAAAGCEAVCHSQT